MSLEDQHTDCKSLRAVPGRTVDWDARRGDYNVAENRHFWALVH